MKVRRNCTSVFLKNNRSRRENSSTEENYEWDANFAMESEILEAVKNYNSSKTNTTVSEVKQIK